jgi:hypothetical protein
MIVGWASKIKVIAPRAILIPPEAVLRRDGTPPTKPL